MTRVLVAGLTFGGAFAADSSSKILTFTKDVAPIFQEKCNDCHRKGTVAPMSGDLRTSPPVGQIHQAAGHGPADASVVHR